MGAPKSCVETSFPFAKNHFKKMLKSETNIKCLYEKKKKITKDTVTGD